MVALTKDIRPGTVRKAERCNRPIALLRSADGLGALVDRCPHRNYPLSEGRVTREELECPCRGRRFGRDGTCLDVPGCAVETIGDRRLDAKPLRVLECHRGIFVVLTAAAPPISAISGGSKAHGRGVRSMRSRTCWTRFTRTIFTTLSSAGATAPGRQPHRHQPWRWHRHGYRADAALSRPCVAVPSKGQAAQRISLLSALHRPGALGRNAKVDPLRECHLHPRDR